MKKIPRRTVLWIDALFAIKISTIALSALSPLTGWAWVPESSYVIQGVALAFVLSSVVFLTIFPPLGLVSTAAFAALTIYGGIAGLIAGRDVAWSLFVVLTSLLLLGFTVRGWRQLVSPAADEG